MRRTILSKLLPNWLRRDIALERQPSSNGLTALASLQRKIRMANKTKPEVKKLETPGQRSAKAHPDRKAASRPKASKTSDSCSRCARGTSTQPQWKSRSKVVRCEWRREGQS